MQLSASPAFLVDSQHWQENKLKPMEKKHCHRGMFEGQMQLVRLGFGEQNLYGLLISQESSPTCLCHHCDSAVGVQEGSGSGRAAAGLCYAGYTVPHGEFMLES